MATPPLADRIVFSEPIASALLDDVMVLYEPKAPELFPECIVFLNPPVIKECEADTPIVFSLPPTMEDC